MVSNPWERGWFKQSKHFFVFSSPHPPHARVEGDGEKGARGLERAALHVQDKGLKLEEHGPCRAGQPLRYFVDHPTSREAQLLPEHVVALRLYTTAAFQSFNAPLRATR